MPSPKHNPLHRLKRLWRFIDNERVEAMDVQMALLPHAIARLGHPHLLGLAIDWTMFNVVAPSDERFVTPGFEDRHPSPGRALPLLQLDYDRDNLLCWKVSKSRAANTWRKKRPEDPWYLATSLSTARSAAAWYRQRGWIEQSFRDAKSHFGLKRVKVGSPERLGRLLVGPTIALCWLTLMALPEGGVLPKGFRSAVVAWGRA